MQARYLLAGVGLVGAGALVLTNMGFGQQDRQYKKTLQYMHDGRDKLEQNMKKMEGRTEAGGKRLLDETK